MASFLMKKRWVPGSQKESAKSPDDPKDASGSSIPRRDRLPNPQRNDNDDDDDDPLLGITPGDSTRRTPPRFRFRAMTTTTSNSGNKSIDNPTLPPPLRSSNGTTASTESQSSRSTTTTTSTFIQNLLSVNKRDIPTTTAASTSNKVLMATRPTRPTNPDEDQPTPIPLDFQSLDDDDDDDDEDEDDGDYGDTQWDTPSSHHQHHYYPTETTELDGSQDRFVTPDKSCSDSTMEQEWNPRHSFSTVNSDIFLNMSQDASAHALAVRFQDVIQLDVSNESSTLSSMAEHATMEIQYQPDIDGQEGQEEEEEENIVDWSADFETNWTGLELSENEHPVHVPMNDDQPMSSTTSPRAENSEPWHDVSHATLVESLTHLSVSSPQVSNHSPEEPQIPPTPNFPMDLPFFSPGDAPIAPTETTSLTQCERSYIPFCVTPDSPVDIMTPKTPMDMNISCMANDILKGPPRQRSSFADVPSLSPKTPHLENGYMPYSYTGIIFGPVQLPSMQCFENHIQKLDLTEEEPQEAATTSTTTKIPETTVDDGQEQSTFRNRKGKHAMDLPPMPALS